MKTLKENNEFFGLFLSSSHKVILTYKSLIFLSADELFMILYSEVDLVSTFSWCFLKNEQKNCCRSLMYKESKETMSYLSISGEREMEKEQALY